MTLPKQSAFSETTGVSGMLCQMAQHGEEREIMTESGEKTCNSKGARNRKLH